MDGDRDGYRDITTVGLKCLLREFERKGYEFKPFSPGPPERTVFLRHDIDFSLEAAAATAEIENALGIGATYFFMLTSNFYNIFSRSGQELVRHIESLGHTISLHFDPTVYEDIDAGFAVEKEVFETIFRTRIATASLHRPQGFLDNNNRRLPMVRHTYEDCYFKDIAYISDSMGAFLHWHPLDSEAFSSGAAIQLLLHPIWWVTSGDTSLDKIGAWQAGHQKFICEEIERNCLVLDQRQRPAAVEA